MKATTARRLVYVTLFLAAAAPVSAAQATAPGAPGQAAATVPAEPAAPVGVPLPPGFVIGSDDLLSVVFWREKEMSADVVVRPDGKISLPLINDVQAAGLTPDQLRQALIQAASKFIENPNATVVVKTINSRKVYVTGNVAKAGTYPLSSDMNVLQLIALAGGLAEYADSKNIVIMRTEGGQQRSFKFNYKDVIRGKGLQQNIMLQPNDTIVIP